MFLKQSMCILCAIGILCASFDLISAQGVGAAGKTGDAAGLTVLAAAQKAPYPCPAGCVCTDKFADCRNRETRVFKPSDAIREGGVPKNHPAGSPNCLCGDGKTMGCACGSAGTR